MVLVENVALIVSRSDSFVKFRDLYQTASNANIINIFLHSKSTDTKITVEFHNWFVKLYRGYQMNVVSILNLLNEL